MIDTAPVALTLRPVSALATVEIRDSVAVEALFRFMPWSPLRLPVTFVTDTGPEPPKFTFQPPLPLSSADEFVIVTSPSSPWLMFHPPPPLPFAADPVTTTVPSLPYGKFTFQPLSSFPFDEESVIVTTARPPTWTSMPSLPKAAVELTRVSVAASSAPT